jgi:hypothetical protein
VDCPELHEDKPGKGEWSRIQRRMMEVKVDSMVTAMRHSKPEQVQLRISNYPDNIHL